MRIVVLDGYVVNPGDNPWTLLAAQGELSVYDRTAEPELVERALHADVVLTNKVALSAEVLARLPGLRGICVLATGVNVVDVAAATQRGLPVCNVPAYSSSSVAQHTVALLLELCHRVGLHDVSVHTGDWQRSPDFSYSKSPLLELEGKKLGIVGYGVIGRRVAAIARALGMSVYAARMSSSAPTATGADGVPRQPLDDLFSSCDVVSLHCPLTPETQKLVSTGRLALLKPNALLINTARGGLIDEHALAAALNAGTLGGAALDVLSSEPPSPDNPLLNAKNCVITPHVAWTSLPARQRLLTVSAANVRALLSGSPENVVNPEYATAVR